MAVKKMRGPFLDTTVLLAGMIDLGPASGPAQRLLDAVAHARIGTPHTAWHCCLEFYSVSTRLPEEYRLTPADALRLLEEEVFARFRVHQVDDALRVPFFKHAALEGVTGGRIYDAHIAEVARSARAEVIVTDNVRHFTPLSSVRVVTTADFVSELGL